MPDVIVLAFGLAHPTLAAPERLLSLLAIPFLVLVVVVVRRRRSRTRMLFTNLPLVVRAARARPRRWSRNLPLVLLALALLAAGVAFARPTVRVKTHTKATTIILLVDVSGSMQATDIPPARIFAAIAGMRALINELPPADKVGLVSFSDKVEVLNDPTTDHAAVESSLRLLTPEGGTAIGEGVTTAVRVAVTSLREGGTVRAAGKYLPAAIVLESDGAQNRGGIRPFQAGQLAAQAGVRIYGVALGTQHGRVVERGGLLARVIPVPPSPGTVALLARESGGQAFTATTAASVNQIYRQLGRSANSGESPTEISHWLDLAAAILLAASVLLARARGGALL